MIATLVSICLLVNIIIRISTSFPDVCLWGKKDLWNATYVYSYANGLYVYNETIAGRGVYYLNDTGCIVSGLYLFYRYDQWKIGINPEENGFIGKCESQDSTIYPYDNECDGLWAVPACDAIALNVSMCPVDSDVIAIEGKCPSWNDKCNTIDVTYTSGNNDDCIGEFIFDNDYDYDNVYSKTMNDDSKIYWYFNQHIFKWICSNEYNINTCQPPSVLQESKATKWNDIGINNDITLDLLSGNTVSIQCTSTPTPTTSPIETTMIITTISPNDESNKISINYLILLTLLLPIISMI